MSHTYDLEGKFLAALGEMDLKRALGVQHAGCPHCGGRLDRADYPRKPRGELGEAESSYQRRISLCCRNEGCRRRATPPSVRFLGRKVYFAALVVIASTIGREAVLVGRGRTREVRGVPVRTVRRWLWWWQTAFAQSAFWKEAKAHFAVPVLVERLPASLLERFADNALERTLGFISPITTTSVSTRFAVVM
jgi:hypothetical protein